MVAHSELVTWLLFILFGIVAGLSTFVHAAGILVPFFLAVGYAMFRNRPEMLLPLYVFSGFYKSVIPGPDLTVVLFGLALLAAFFKMYREREDIFPRFRSVSIFTMLLFLFWMMLSLIYTYSNGPAIEKAVKVLLLTGGAFFLPLILVDSQKKYANVLLAIVSLGTTMSFVSVVTGERTVFGSNYLSLGFISSLSVLIFLFYFYPKTKHWLVWIAIVINIFGMVHSAARAPIFFLPLTVIVVVAVSKFKLQKKVKLYVGFVLLFFVLITSLYVAVPSSFELLITRLNAIEDAQGDDNARYRTYHVEQAMSLLRTHPLTGVGIGAYGIQVEGVDERLYPHNIFLEIGAELGIPGIILFTLLLIQVMSYYFFHRGNVAYVDHTLLACVLYSFINTLKAGNLVDNRIFFLFLGLILITGNIFTERRGEE